MAVRKCNFCDLEFLVRGAAMFNDEFFRIPLSLTKTRVAIAGMIQNGVVLRTDNGFIGGVVYEDPMRDWTILAEAAWFSTQPGEGKELLKAFEEEGKRLGVDEVRMSTLETYKPAEAMLMRLGYSPIEHSYRKLM